jgi:hypothetical protein
VARSTDAAYPCRDAESIREPRLVTEGDGTPRSLLELA